LGSVTLQKVFHPLAPRDNAASSSCVLARDEGEGDEDGGEHHAGEGKDDLDVLALEV
jgi:hypothetical protein